LKGDAPVNVKDNSYRGTPLGWALYGWCNPAPEANRAGYYKVVARLVAAGATVEPEWLADPDRETPFDDKLHADPRMLAALAGKMPPRQRWEKGGGNPGSSNFGALAKSLMPSTNTVVRPTQTALGFRERCRLGVAQK
jgi:hypothetical protein